MMAWQTPKTDWKFYDIPTAGDFNRIEENARTLKTELENNYVKQTDFELHKNDYVSQMAYAVASGTNSYTVSIPGITTLVDGLSVKIKFTNANTGAATLNINGLGAKQIRKSNGNALSAGNIKAGQICHLVYTGSVFQLLGEGGEYGTAQPEHVLEGYTIGTEEGVKPGTMPNRGAMNSTITTQGGQIVVPQGYHPSGGVVKANFANLVAGNIKSGVNIGGVVGNLSGLFNLSTANETIINESFSTPDVNGNAEIYSNTLFTAPSNTKLITIQERYTFSAKITQNDTYNASYIYLYFGGIGLTINRSTDEEHKVGGIVLVKGADGWFALSSSSKIGGNYVYVDTATGNPSNLSIKILHKHRGRSGYTSTLYTRFGVTITTYS
jgi:hypothetical protein